MFCVKESFHFSYTQIIPNNFSLVFLLFHFLWINITKTPIFLHQFHHYSLITPNPICLHKERGVHPLLLDNSNHGLEVDFTMTEQFNDSTKWRILEPLKALSLNILIFCILCSPRFRKKKWFGNSNELQC